MDSFANRKVTNFCIDPIYYYLIQKKVFFSHFGYHILQNRHEIDNWGTLRGLSNGQVLTKRGGRCSSRVFVLCWQFR